MNRLLAVTARELRERWLLFPASLVFGLNPLVFPAFGLDRQLMPFLGTVTAFGLAAAAAVIMGSTMLARDAANGRLGFLFSRPLSSATIWGGKWLAALVLVSGSGALAAIPFMAAYPSASYGGSWLATLAHEPAWAFVLGVVMLGVGVANLLATAYRSRSPWLVIDMVLLAAAVWIVRREVAPLWLVGAMGAGNRSLVVLLLPLAVGLLAGSAVQVAAGRTDARRAHRALSLTFWAVVFAALAVATCWLAWIDAAGPAEMRTTSVLVGANERWLYLEAINGRRPWHAAGLLLDTETGNHLLTTPTLSYLGREAAWQRALERFSQQVSFSADGLFAAYWSPDAARGSTAVVRIELAGGTVRTQRIGLASTAPPAWWTALALSPSGGQAVLVGDTAASLHELPSGQAVASCTVTPGWRATAIRFRGEDAARVWMVSLSGGSTRASDEIRVLDIGRGGVCRPASFTVPARPDAPPRPPVVNVDVSGARLLTRRDSLELRDGATGTLTATLIDGEDVLSARFLGDGRIAAITKGARGSGLRVFGADGALLASADLSREPGWIGTEIAPGRLVVALGWLGHPRGSVVVDAADGQVVQRLEDLTPAAGRSWLGDYTAEPYAGHAMRASYFTDTKGQLVRLDAVTGDRRVVAGPGAPSGRRLAAN